MKWATNKNERQAMIEFAQHNIFPQPAENDIIAGTERVKTWLHRKQLWFVDGVDGYSCPLTIKQMKAYRWAESKTRDGQLRDKEKVYKKNDELPDCIRYALMTWPELPEAPVVSTQRDISMLPPETQYAIQRMRRIEDRVEEKGPTVVGDFFL